MANHPVSDHLPCFDRYSYLLVITAAFVEVVAMGCKRLALSSPYTDAELSVLLAPTQQLVEEAGLALLVEPNRLITPLFPADATAFSTPSYMLPLHLLRSTHQGWQHDLPGNSRSKLSVS